MTRDDILAVIARIPELTEFGVGVFAKSSHAPESYQAEFTSNQADLLTADSVAACTRVETWLADHARQTKTFSRGYTSYWLKHVVERDIGYVTNGQFIAAAVHSGYKYELIPDNPNVYLCFRVLKRCLT